MIKVTDSAKEALKSRKEKLSGSHDQAFRLESDSPGEVDMLELDMERPGDYVIEADGEKLLVVSPEISSIVGDATIDCEITSEIFDKHRVPYLHIAKDVGNK